MVRCLIFCLTLTFFGCSDHEGDDQVALRPVRTETVEVSNGARYRSFAGVTQSGVESKLSFRVPGIINKLSVKVGDVIQAGTVIAQLDPADYILKVEETEATLLQTKAQERHAAANYARIRDLYETYSTSRNELDAARAESESANAAVEAMQKKLAMARSQLSYTTLRAPVDGSIAAVKSEVNENTMTGEPVVTLSYGSNLEVKVSVPEILVADIHAGDSVTVSLDALPGEYFPAVVTEVGVIGDEGTTFPVTVELESTPEAIRAGMAAEVQFKFYSSGVKSSIFVPTTAVVGDGMSRYVYIVEDQGQGIGRVGKKLVVVGELTGSGLEIITGLSGGEEVVTAGVSLLQDGQKVRIE